MSKVYKVSLRVLKGGLQGRQGTQGLTGAFGGGYDFNTNTGTSDPGLKVNNANRNLCFVLLDDVDENGTDI